jgi:MoxR-like ATPase
MAMTPDQARWFSDTFASIVRNIERAILGKTEAIRLSVTCMLAEGHLLLEDFPGTGKTTLARSIAQTVQGSHSRIQFTPDLLPSDVTGVTIFDQKSSSFEFHQGPIFASIVLADEINRASPKTQSALLEVMEEHRVTVDGVSYDVGTPFMVIATQNPIEQAGTYRLPEAQLDRFLMKTTLGYPDRQTSSADPHVRRLASAVGGARTDHHDGRDRRDEPARPVRTRRAVRPGLHRPPRRGHPDRRARTPRRLDPWRLWPSRAPPACGPRRSAATTSCPTT